MDTNFVNKEDIIYEDELIELPDGISSKLEEDTEIYITKHITVKTIIHSLVPIEYPPTSERGIAIIYHIERWENKEAVFSNVQYSMGLKMCEFADLELKEMEHKSVDPDSDLCLKINQELSTSNKKNNTFVVYLVASKTKCRYVTNGVQCIRKPVLKYLRRHDETTPPSYFIEKCSYIILISKGIHFHLPPPPNRVPVTIQDHLQELIHQANDDTVDVTPTRIITGNLIKTYFGTEYLADMHASLNNADHLRYYVNKIQKEIYP
ncbi:hypothetical protein GLOIN_2v1791412 [Rhizophagus irregularis DAOM 181602=DAOM 197198]|uniref:Uncharacterized protein n=1 Tax=Rhizophagus irregularis (strain DAOM 181602 / DAOM 197198 / MUCL 43194) TaxID=747089 RepID=A0A2P4NX43_RHIID|nr:hypothetical protein GLOIN_2v1791412 [Rhizophagus irregularis DAOM 181602=DAOM 197198]POG57709.1 hypothetical protein GLOIN_2v1791412 [Rhizophagus irregularis DAOM 181602=DAOM 197198]|eukprot:XP_025164575.1 hypothetical protein GLOIN_2v1791412 [Rhizophagus irregularis DAOM 181602=DAOM 197198]